MSGIVTDVRSARRSRAMARAPRVAILATAAVLSLAGLRAALAGDRNAPQPASSPPNADLAAEALAERFARAYLEVDPATPEARERALDALAPGLTDEGLDSDPGEVSTSVEWTATVADRREAGGRVLTVAAETNLGNVHLAVPVERDTRGFLRITAPPAIVGGPPSAGPGGEGDDERDVEDPRLRAVAERAVRNYLAGERRDLAADLAPEAVVSLPGRPLAVRGAERIVWLARPRLLAVDVHAHDRETGARPVLRYRLATTRRAGRWQVVAIGDRPTHHQGERR